MGRPPGYSYYHILKSWPLTSNSTWTETSGSGGGAIAQGTNQNAAGLAGLQVAAFACPSSAFDQMKLESNGPGAGLRFQTGNYVIVTGSTRATLKDSTNKRGQMSGAGIFGPARDTNGQSIGKNFKVATDGLSKSIMAGEQSDFSTDGLVIRPGSWQQWMGREQKGATANANGEWNNGNPTGGSQTRCFQQTTIHYALNFKERITNKTSGQDCNTPIQSTHPGGANVLFGDGSVSFLNETMELITLQRLADANDGEVVTWP